MLYYFKFYNLLNTFLKYYYPKLFWVMLIYQFIMRLNIIKQTYEMSLQKIIAIIVSFTLQNGILWL